VGHGEPAGLRGSAAVTVPGQGRAPTRTTVRIGDATFIVEIEELPAGRLRVLVDGNPVEVDARLPASGAGSLLLDGVSYAVDLGCERGDPRVVVDGEVLEVHVADGARRRPGASAPTGPGGGQRLLAPMPGKVVAVLVEVGQRVERGASLVVLEAMKMENEFRATGAGVVSAIHVAPGQAVSAGDLLLVVD
jgi:acetyl/propionyl-CoA carboxylase alpha subunit